MLTAFNSIKINQGLSYGIGDVSVKKGILYQEIAAEMKHRIFDGTYPVGSLIPTEVNLEAEFSVSKITIRNAVELLASQGYLEKKSGYGTKVISDSLFNKLSKARSYSTLVKERGVLRKEVVLLEMVPGKLIPDYPTATFEMVHLRRLYYLDEQPFVLFDHYLPTVQSKSQLSGIEEKSLYTILAQNGQTINSFKDEFRASEFNESIAISLKTKKKFGIERIRRGYSLTGQVIEYSHAYYDTNKVPYEIDYEI